MVQIDLGDFTLNVPLKQRMDVHEFLTIAERLQGLQGARTERHEELPAFEPPRHEHHKAHEHARAHAHPEAREEEFYLNKRDELQHLLQQMRVQNKRLEQHDELIVQMLEYMQSMTEHLNKR